MENLHRKRNLWLFLTTVLLFLVLVICTLFGDEIYTLITPKVPVQMVKSVIHEDGETYVHVPKRAVTEENTVFVVTSEQGFSRTIYRVWELAVDYIENRDAMSEVIVLTKLPGGSFLVTEPEVTRRLQDGDKVLIRKAGK